MVAKNPTNPKVTMFHFLLLSAILAFFPLTTSQLAPAAGEWRLLQESIGLSAMHMQLLSGDKVVMFDRADFGPSNLSLPPASVTAPQTATPAAPPTPSSTTSPLTPSDPSTSELTSGVPPAHSFPTAPSSRPVASTPVTVPPISSTNWSEHPGYLSARRWYATDQLLPDGRILILGGRQQLNYEFSPSTGTAIPFPFLQETRDGTSENNLYPFVHLLPDGTLFIFANNRAVILDSRRHRVLLRLPAIPGGTPRNYPHVRVLVGGSNPHVHYNFTYGPAYSTQLSLEVFHPPANYLHFDGSTCIKSI